MTSVLTLTDGTQTVLEDTPAVRRYGLSLMVDGAVADRESPNLGPLRNALYAQALFALMNSVELQAMQVDLSEGGENEQSLDVHLALESAIDGGGGPTAGFTLHLVCEYDQRDTDPNRREAILQAIRDALDENQTSETVCVRERVVAALVALLDDALPGAIHRDPDRALRFPVGDLVVREGGHTADYDGPNRTTYRMPLTVVGIGADEAAAADAAVAALAIVRSADRLGGIAVDVEEGDTEVDLLDERETGGAFAVGLTALVTFATRIHDPYAEAA